MKLDNTEIYIAHLPMAMSVALFTFKTFLYMAASGGRDQPQDVGTQSNFGHRPRARSRWRLGHFQYALMLKGINLINIL